MGQTPWTPSKASEWYRGLPWIVGCNYTPSSAVNSLEMWQGGTFDAEMIARELSWAAAAGLNGVRVFLHSLVWEADAEGLKHRVDTFLRIADQHDLSTLFVLFDDCWGEDPTLGPQPDPVPGVHNSRWVQCPGAAVVTDADAWPRLEGYVSDMVGAYADDERILAWDLYNEPGNGSLGDRSLPLLSSAFEWARAAGPSQPLTAGIWSGDRATRDLNALQLQASDVITFHSYDDQGAVLRQIDRLKAQRRPLICTEWLARTAGSPVFTHLSLFKREKVGCYAWGLVAGRTQTIYAWGSKEGAPAPKTWFHDLFAADGTPYDPKEIDLFRRLTGRGADNG